MDDFKQLPKGAMWDESAQWGTSSTERPEYKAEQAAKTESLREFLDGDTIPYRQAFPKDYQIKHMLGVAAGSATGTEALVCEDIAKRQQAGINKYGTTVCANPLELKQWLQHAYEEALDQAIYLKRAIQELDK